MPVPSQCPAEDSTSVRKRHQDHANNRNGQWSLAVLRGTNSILHGTNTVRSSMKLTLGSGSCSYRRTHLALCR